MGVDVYIDYRPQPEHLIGQRQYQYQHLFISMLPGGTRRIYNQFTTFLLSASEISIRCLSYSCLLHLRAKFFLWHFWQVVSVDLLLQLEFNQTFFFDSAVLRHFLNRKHLFDESVAKDISIAYDLTRSFTSVIGWILSAYLGKYKAIVSLSIVYMLGNIALPTATLDQFWEPIIR